MSTKIEWTDETWNPIVGCTRCSPGCDNCYAIRVAHRGLAPQHRGLTIRPEGGPTDWTGEVRFVPEVLDQPLRWTRPRRIFVCSMSDLFHPDVPDDVILRIWTTMRAASQHTFQVLTKRPQRMASLVRRVDWRTPTADERAAGTTGYQAHFGGDYDGAPSFVPPNIWLGVSIESNAYAWRADHLRNTPAAVRFISAEPLLGPLDQLSLDGIDWVIAGGESGPGARPMHPDWVRDLRGRCTSLSCPECGGAGGPEGYAKCELYEDRRVAFLFKQWGEWRSSHAVGEPISHLAAVWVNRDDGSVATTPSGSGYWTQARKYGKRAAGRVLDGRTWDQFPDRHDCNEEVPA